MTDIDDRVPTWNEARHFTSDDWVRRTYHFALLAHQSRTDGEAFAELSDWLTRYKAITGNELIARLSGSNRTSAQARAFAVVLANAEQALSRLSEEDLRDLPGRRPTRRSRK